MSEWDVGGEENERVYGRSGYQQPDDHRSYDDEYDDERHGAGVGVAGGGGNETGRDGTGGVGRDAERATGGYRESPGAGPAEWGGRGGGLGSGGGFSSGRTTPAPRAFFPGVM